MKQHVTVVLRLAVYVEMKDMKKSNNSSSHSVERMVVEVAQRVYSGRVAHGVDAWPFEVVVSQFLDGDSRDDGAASPDTSPTVFYHTYEFVRWVSRNYIYVEYQL